MQKEDEKLNNSGSNIKSCNDRIEGDLVASQNPTGEQIRVVKSQPEEEDKNTESWHQLNRKEKEIYKQGIKEEFGVKIKKKDQLNQSGAVRMRVLAQDTESEEISIDQSFNSQSLKVEHEKEVKRMTNDSHFRILQEKRRQDLSKPLNFNVFFAGGSNMGKTTFIDCFLHKKYQKQPLIRDKTDKLIEHIWLREYQSLKLEIRLIDYPGFREGSVNSYVVEVEKIVRKRLENYSIQKKSLYLERIDERIHCCLYFLNGPRVNDNDWKIMKSFQKYVNIIPVIGKSDIYTIEQLKEFKKAIFIRQKEDGVNWFNGEEYIRQNYPEELKNLLNGPFGIAPPFVIAGCNEHIQLHGGKMNYARAYRWGVCELENENHTDYHLLKKFLVSYFSYQLIKYTDSIQNNLKDLEEEENALKLMQIPHKSSILLTGVFILGLGVVTCLWYQKKK